MVRVSRRFVDGTLWPEFEELQRTLQEYFDTLTDRIIQEALQGDTREGSEEGGNFG